MILSPITEAIAEIRQRGMAGTGEQIVVVAGMPFGSASVRSGGCGLAEQPFGAGMSGRLTINSKQQVMK